MEDMKGLFYQAHVTHVSTIMHVMYNRHQPEEDYTRSMLTEFPSSTTESAGSVTEKESDLYEYRVCTRFM
jgi:hypothetical protein